MEIIGLFNTQTCRMRKSGVMWDRFLNYFFYFCRMSKLERVFVVLNLNFQGRELDKLLRGLVRESSGYSANLVVDPHKQHAFVGYATRQRILDLSTLSEIEKIYVNQLPSADFLYLTNAVRRAAEKWNEGGTGTE